MFSAIEFSISIDDELSALLADYAAFTGDGSAPAGDLPLVLPSDPAPAPTVAPDPLAVVDPMVDVVGLPGLDGLFQMEGDGFDLDLTILEVGRGFGQFGFTDLP